MSRLVVTVVLSALLAAPVLGQDVGTDPSNVAEVPAENAADEVKPDTAEASEAAIIADCNARKFETSVELEKDGKKRLTRMKLCSTAQSDDAAWVRTLEDAKVKISAHPDISAESKASISDQIDAEIAKVAGKPQQ
jgi:hypothetical protein